MAKARASKKQTAPRKGRIVLSGDVKTSGQVTGTGTLSLRVSDAAKVKWSVIKKQKSVLLRLESSVGLSIRQDRELTLSGAIDRDLTKKTLDGRVGVKLEIPDRATFKIEQKVGKGKTPTTSLSVTIKF